MVNRKRHLKFSALFVSIVAFYCYIFSVIAVEPSVFNKIPDFDFRYGNISQGFNLNETGAECSNVAISAQTIQNPGFELGLADWVVVNAVSIVSTDCQSGKYCVRIGKVTQTNGESKISQNFLAAPGQNFLSFWYKMSCHDGVMYDWMTAVLADHTTGTIWNMPKTCKTSTTWKLVTTSVISGHSYTLSFINKDDNNPFDATSTLLDNISLSPNFIASCVGFNSEFWYKYDLQHPVVSTSNFYVHSVTKGMQFAQLKGWDSIGTDILGMPLIVPSASTCAYLCTLLKDCVGAVWDFTKLECWLKNSYGPPTQVLNRNMIIPVGNSGCPISVIASGDCIRSSYNIIPNFDFMHSAVAVTYTDQTDAVIKCEVDLKCVGFDSNYTLKNDVTQAIVSLSDFYVHAVTFGMEFALIKGWDSIGSDVLGYTGMPITTENVEYCTYLCTLSVDCIGAVWDSTSRECWLKAAYGPPSQHATRSMLIPVGSGGCPTSVLIAGNCIQSTLSNKIPNFDFIGTSIDIGRTNDIADAIIQCFIIDPLCIGFNGSSYRKNDFTGAVISSSDFYVNIVTSDTPFAQLVGWDSAGIDLDGYAGVVLPISTVSYCAYLCTNTTGCVGAVWDPTQTRCWLKAKYGPPIQVSNRNMLIPVGISGCSGSSIVSDNCISMVNDERTLCQIMVTWNLYPDETYCLFHIKTEYSTQIEFRYGHAIVVNLNQFGISGKISSELAKLTALQDLQLNSNHLTGTIPIELIELTKLLYFSLNSNQLTGTIPSELQTMMTSLYHMSLNSNQLSGTIPFEKNEMIKLQYLDLGSNQLNGSIPFELSKSSALYYFSLSNNQLTGTVPSELCRLTYLYYFSLSYNQLNGIIPSELSYLSALQGLILYSNQLTGTIPSELSRLNGMLGLALGSNHLTGTVPYELSELTQLFYLDLSTNQLTGTIPVELSKLNGLRYLLLYKNDLIGGIPSELSQLSILEGLMLHNNRLTGTIPSRLGLLTNLLHFYIPDNQLIGTFPTEICLLTSLKSLGLYGNKLSGTLPTQLAQLKELQTLNIDNNLLTIPLPDEVIQYFFIVSGFHLTEVVRPTTHNTNSFMGFLPSQIGLMRSLENIVVDNNLLTGALPSEFGLLKQLESISMTSNQLTGTIPSELGELRKLKEMRFSNNQLTGTIASELGYLSSLLNLFLSSNELNGSIPKEFSKLTALERLQLSNNRLTGSIASQLGQLKALQIFDVNTNRLSGPLPSELGNLVSIQYLTFDHNNRLNGTISNEMCMLEHLVLMTVSIGLICPVNCTSKCLKLEFYNPTVIPVHSPTYLPTNLRVAETSSSSSLSTVGIIGIVISSFIVILASFIGFFFVLWRKCSEYDNETNNKSIENTDNDPMTNLIMYLKINNLKMFNWNDFEIDTIDHSIVIGEGSFGIVIRTKLVATTKYSFSNMAVNEDLAIKVIKMRNVLDAAEYDSVLKEVKNHFSTESRIDNKNCIVKLYGVVDGQLPYQFSEMLNVKSALGIVMRYEAGGSLSSLLHGVDVDVSTSQTIFDPISSNSNLSKIDIPLTQKVRILQNIAKGLAELHKSGIVHGDLKPDNILLSSKDISQAEIHLADFGFAEIRLKSHLGVGMSSLVRTTQERGTPVYSAPEQLYNPNTKSIYSDKKYAKPSKKTNIYSFAIIAWEILTQQKPFANIATDADLSVIVHQGVRPDVNQLPVECPVVLRTMMNRCWDSNRNHRLSAIQCYITLRECFELLVNTQYDIYLVYKHASPKELIIRSIANRLLENGFKVAPMYDDANELNQLEWLNKRVEIIKQSKVILLCLEVAVQVDRGCLYELGNNRGLKRPRPVIPLFIEPPKGNFPDNEIKIHCFMGRIDTKVFDISSFISIESTNIDYDKNSLNPVLANVAKTSDSSSLVGVDPMDIELKKLIDYINYRINELCVITE